MGTGSFQQIVRFPPPGWVEMAGLLAAWLLLCLTIQPLQGNFCCKDQQTWFHDDKVCDGVADCPLTETSQGGEDVTACEGCGDGEDGEGYEGPLDWCQDPQDAPGIGAGPIAGIAVLVVAVVAVLAFVGYNRILKPRYQAPEGQGNAYI